ncbi:SMI1/KNR4 family protein [Streptomyces sp. NBC_00158]
MPEELKALYRVTRVRSADGGGDEGEYEGETHAAYGAVGCELGSLDELCFADVTSRPADWETAARTALFAPPDAPVQGLVGSPGRLVFAGSGYGDPIAVDLTPGPGGHTGQIVLIDHEKHTGAVLLADSLTDLVTSAAGAARAPGLPKLRPWPGSTRATRTASGLPPTPHTRSSTSADTRTGHRSASAPSPDCPACGPCPRPPPRSRTRWRPPGTALTGSGNDTSRTPGNWLSSCGSAWRRAFSCSSVE